MFKGCFFPTGDWGYMQQGIIDFTGQEIRQIFPRMFVMAKYFEEFFTPT